MPDDIFTGWVAEQYDSDPRMFDAGLLERTVAFLADLAGGRPALEFGIGTGRVALPLSMSGVDVYGIDLSQDMVARLRAKPGAARLRVTIGNFATTTVPGEFSVVYLVYNTISNLTSQDEQVECFRNAAAHLIPGGRFVIELAVPDLQRFPPGALAQPFDVSAGHLGFDTIDVATQRGVSHHYVIDRDRVSIFETPYRYAWPAELDLMARMAGLELRERWADWDRTPFTSDSRKHISVWERPR
jgi:SAM-dependent methyltransferase